MIQKTFTKTRIATSLSLILGATALPAISAETGEQTDKKIEVIEVTGIRSSMVKSMDLKRSSQGIVDAINAEDIGKFPDSNLAESLQRITGVSIDRANGEGSKVSVRGFSAERNLVLLNGRQLPTTTGGRSFDFANIAAEGISTVEVFKTSVASAPTGGIGATIDIGTNRPLNNPGMHAVVSGQGLYDTSATDSSTTPELSGIYSNTFDDDKFGISISGSFSERESGSQQAGVSTGWRSFDDNGGWGGIPADNQINRPGADDIYSVPQTTFYKFEEQQRERTNAQLVLQYRPIEDVTATLDYTYIRKDTDTQFNDISAWYTFAPSVGVWTDGPAASPLLYSEVYANNQDVATGVGDYGVRDETKSLGLNIEWQVNDSMSLELDYHDSSAKNTPNNEFGSNNNFAMRADTRLSTATDFTGDLPILAVGGGNTTLASDLYASGSTFENNQNHANTEQLQVKGNYIFEEAGSIDFGISLTEASNRGQTAIVQRDNWGGEGAAGDYDSAWFTADSIQDKFDQASGGNFSTFIEQVGVDWASDILDTYYIKDFDAIRDRAEQLLSVQSTGDCGTSFCPSTDYAGQTDRWNEEQMTALYLQYNYEGEIGDMPFDVHLGVRYEETDIESVSAVNGYNGSEWRGDSEVLIIQSGERIFGAQSASYDHTLPSFNFNLEITDDIILRAAYSETIGRPDYASMQGGTTLASSARVSNGTGSSGNPGLLPLESQNYDLSAEWYYGEGSYVSLGYFKKDVTNEIIQGKQAYTQDDIYNPASSTYVNEAIAAGASPTDFAAIRQWIFDNYAATDPTHVFDSAGQIVIIGQAGDDLMNFEIDAFSNSSDESGFDGLEFAVQHLFGESGFGGIINYTKVDSENEYDNTILGSEFNDAGTARVLSDQVAETGISDTANLVGFYEKDGISIRIAYNWRDKYLNSHFQGDVGPSPAYIEAYSQVDLTVSYDVPQVEGLNVFFNGINITDEYTRTSGRNEREVLNLTQTGARYSLGARYSF
jgi:TonB-dependent receptor